VYLVLQPGWGQTNETTGQNSPFSDQTQVPLIWFGWKIRPSVVESQVSPIDIVPTIASMLNMAKPSATTGGVIHGISVE
jgi:arylsulfatase A-like enzyme